MTIFIGADHRGYALKEHLKETLSQQGHNVIDKGNVELDPNDDFPEFAFAVAIDVAQDPTSKGIVICGSGTGVNMAANKVRGIRASTAINADEVKHARQHDDMNVLCLSADYISQEVAEVMVAVFLTTPFEPTERFTRRVNMITEYEAAHIK